LTGPVKRARADLQGGQGDGNDMSSVRTQSVGCRVEK
jgi:hypothetical protein